MITNSVVIWILTLALGALAGLNGISVAVQHQELSHTAENLAIVSARIAMQQTEISARDICSSLPTAKGVTQVSCEVSRSEVKISLSKPVYLLGRRLTVTANSRVGFGFYSQNNPR